ncbi:hypothetical protein BDV19DRAFT_387377 [Aspergillus venezuelensis]
MSGAPWSEEDFRNWIDTKKVMNSYGPQECTVKATLAQLIPDMTPNSNEFPMTATGKIHRFCIRVTYAEQTLEQLLALDILHTSSHQAPSSASEKLLQELWTSILCIDPEVISAEDSFLRIGGDSLGAMRLVSALRIRGFAITFADVFQKPKLSALARLVDSEQASQEPTDSSLKPFSLIEGNLARSEAIEQAAHLCSLEPNAIEDIFPCTPLQVGLLAETVWRPGSNVLTETWMLKQDIELSTWVSKALYKLWSAPGMRTLKSPCQKQNWALERLYYCTSSPRLASHGRYITLPTMDGSMPLIFDALSESYASGAILDAPPFQTFIKYIGSRSDAEAENFWKGQFADFGAQNFPVLPSKTYKPKCDEHLELEFKDISHDGDCTTPTRIRAAWTILLSTITNFPDASFGATVSGRQADVHGIENMTGPTMATVPLRVAINRTKTVGDLLQQVQLQAVQMMPFEQVGIQQIRRLSEDCDLGCQFGSHMVIQHQHGGQQVVQNRLLEPAAETSHSGPDPFKLYAICLEFVLEPNSIRLQARFDSSVMPPSYFSRLMARFENIMRQLSSQEILGKPLAVLDTSSSRDLQQIWSWNDTNLEESRETIHGVFEKVAARQPDPPAVCSWDGDFTYAQVDDFSTRIAHALLQAGLRQSGQRIVPLFFEKSK